MKVLIINGSPKPNGNTFIALDEVSKSLESEGVDTEIVHVGSKPIRGCLACGQCSGLKECVTHDLVNEVLVKFKEADGLIVGSPVYYASPAGTLVSFLDRLFFASKFDKTMKVGASVAVARRGGTTATFDVLNKYFTISNMPIVSSSYWNNVHGAAPGEAKDDAEGLQTMRRLGKNMAFLIKAIRLAKDVMPLPALDEMRQITSFIH
jgi:multimeric flavodoxin WrbA